MMMNSLLVKSCGNDAQISDFLSRLSLSDGFESSGVSLDRSAASHERGRKHRASHGAKIGPVPQKRQPFSNVVTSAK